MRSLNLIRIVLLCAALLVSSVVLVGTQQAVWAQGTGAETSAGTAPHADEIAGAIDRLAAVAGRAPFQTTRILDRHGNLLYEISDEGKRTVISIAQVPQHLINATVATEDKNFFAHLGVDYSAIARAAIQNWQADEVVSGASTITQQLARTLQLGNSERYEVTLQRKLKEASLAAELENAYTKSEILELYMNSVYYGHQAYGVAAAAETYFRKDVSELSLAESAIIAGLPQLPVEYDPFLNPETALGRQRVVLALMQRQGYISAAERQAALAESIRFIEPPLPVLRAPHFVDYVREALIERYGTEGIRQGLQVHTSIDLRYQQLAQTIARAQIDEIGRAKQVKNGAVVILNPPTGQILAMVGSLSYYDEAIDGQVNLATSPRQPGSSIKPILYASALENGWTPASILWDIPTRYPLADGKWYAPTNITGQFYGPTRLRFALSNSLNVPPIKLLDELGIENMLDTARRLGVHSLNGDPINYGLSLAVGGYEISLLELTHAFATLANGGAYIPLHPITEITDSAGRTIYGAEIPETPEQAVSPQTAYQISNILSDARTRQVVFGRNTPLNTSQPAAVKTGTTDGWRDNLTVGYTPYVTVGVWLGNSDGRVMKDAIGSENAGPIWHDIMEAIWATPSLHPTIGYVNQPLPQGFSEPGGLYKAAICDLRGFNNSCPRAYDELFKLPDATAPARKGDISPDTPGWCLPALVDDIPPGLETALRFMPLPQNELDRASARSWANKHNLALRTADECTVTLTRTSAAPLPLPEPKRLIFIPATRPTPGGLWPGNRAVITDDVSGLNIRKQADDKAAILGSLKRGQIAVISKGPETVNNTQWFEIRVLRSGLQGWVHGRYLRPLPPSDESLGVAGAADAGGFPPGAAVRLRSGVEGLNMRDEAGLGRPIVASIKPAHSLIVQAGPEMIENVPWYRLENLSNGIKGWVDGRYLVPENGE